MAAAVDSKYTVITEKNGEAERQISQVLKSSDTTQKTSLLGVNTTRLPAEDSGPLLSSETRSTFHIYQKKECHKCISPTTDHSKERWSGPTLKEQRAKRKERKERKTSGLTPVKPDDNAFFLHKPYLAFHRPPRVLYVGNSKWETPAVLIHENCFWREYKLQLGPSIAMSDVLDPRGVVSWRHNGGDRKTLKKNDKKLKGYKVRTWRLWGETGAAYVHSVKESRKSGTGFDPDVLEEPGFKPIRPVEAEEAVYLRWMNPLSRHTRRYHFRYAGIDFYWKGTGTVKESRMCGLFLHFNHLKLVARLPSKAIGEDETQPEICLGKFTSSIADKKSGSLDFFDVAILRFVERYTPKLLARRPHDQLHAQIEDEPSKISRLKKSALYQVFVATGMCMIISEKEKRHTLLGILAAFAEGAGGAGG
ncbi:Nn.00g045700.m01.CDS01 [Neocucurbitaria sp. VM-36]